MYAYLSLSGDRSDFALCYSPEPLWAWGGLEPPTPQLYQSCALTPELQPGLQMLPARPLTGWGTRASVPPLSPELDTAARGRRQQVVEPGTHRRQRCHDNRPDSGRGHERGDERRMPA